MNIIMSSPNQKSNAPSFIGLARKVKQEDTKTQNIVSTSNKGYNDELTSYLYLVDFYKKLEDVENEVMKAYRYFCTQFYIPSMRYNFNGVLDQMDPPPYITVTPIPV